LCDGACPTYTRDDFPSLGLDALEGIVSCLGDGVFEDLGDFAAEACGEVFERGRKSSTGH
jgi:hypothetical protein